MLILSSKEVDGRKAWRLNLVDECVDQDKLLQRAKEIIRGSEAKRYQTNLRDTASAFRFGKNSAWASI